MKKLNYYNKGIPSKKSLPEQMKDEPLNLYKEERLKKLVQDKQKSLDLEQEVER